MSHPIFTLLTAFLLSIAMAMVEGRTARERWYIGVRMFASCIVAIAGGGWLMRLIHG
jgi:hypothetical protein